MYEELLVVQATIEKDVTGSKINSGFDQKRMSLTGDSTLPCQYS